LKNSFGVFAQKTRRARMPYKRSSQLWKSRPPEWNPRPNPSVHGSTGPSFITLKSAFGLVERQEVRGASKQKIFRHFNKRHKATAGAQSNFVPDAISAIHSSRRKRLQKEKPPGTQARAASVLLKSSPKKGTHFDDIPPFVRLSGQSCTDRD